MDKRAKLVKLLHDKTQQGEIKWEESLADDNTYTASFPNYSVGVTVDEEQIYYILIYNLEGKEIDRISAQDVYGELGSEVYSMLLNTYNRARRYALGVEDALDAILNQLGDDIPF